MSPRLIIDGNAVYEIDEDCIRKKYREKDGGKEKYFYGNLPKVQERYRKNTTSTHRYGQ